MTRGRDLGALLPDRRAVQAPVSYSLTLSIALILVSGLLIGGTTMVSDQRERTMESQLATLAQQVAGSVETADRIVNSTDGSANTLVLQRRLPDAIMGSGYFVQIDQRDGVPGVQLDATDDDVVVWVEMDVGHEVIHDRVRGGDLEVRWEDGDGDGDEELVVVDA